MAKENLQEIAKMLYLKGDSQKEIAEKLEVSETSLSNWKRKGKWDDIKKNLLNSRNERLSELYDELAEFNRMIKDRKGYKVADSKEADARRKLVADIRDLERRYNIGYTVCVARDFIEFTKNLDAEFSKKALKFFDAFINHKIDQKTWGEQ